MNKASLWIFVILILGALGYFLFTSKTAPSSTSQPTTPTSTTNTPTATTPTSTPAAPTAATPDSPLATPTAIDSTWQTFTSRAGSYTFQFPTKGRYSPTWGTSQVNQDCALPEGFTQADHTSTITVGDVSFCHTSVVEGAAGSSYNTDTYTTKNESKFLALTFTKHVYSAGALNCKFPAGINYSTSPTSCVAFDPAAYQATLDQIVGTFTLITNK